MTLLPTRSSTHPMADFSRWPGDAVCSASGIPNPVSAAARCSTRRAAGRAPIRAPCSAFPTASRQRFRTRSPSAGTACLRWLASGASSGSGIPLSEPIAPPTRLPPFVLGLAFSPDGSQLAIPFGYNNQGLDGVAEVLDVERASGSRGCAPRPRSVRSPSRRTADCWQAARSTERRSCGDRRPATGRGPAGGRSRVRDRARLSPGRPDACHVQRRRHRRAVGRGVSGTNRLGATGPARPVCDGTIRP